MLYTVCIFITYFIVVVVVAVVVVAFVIVAAVIYVLYVRMYVCMFFHVNSNSWYLHELNIRNEFSFNIKILHQKYE